MVRPISCGAAVCPGELNRFWGNRSRRPLADGHGSVTAVKSAAVFRATTVREWSQKRLGTLCPGGTPATPERGSQAVRNAGAPIPALVGAILAAMLWPVLLSAQTQPDMAGVVERLDRLERENRAMLEEIRALRAELTAAHGPTVAATATGVATAAASTDTTLATTAPTAASANASATSTAPTTTASAAATSTTAASAAAPSTAAISANASAAAASTSTAPTTTTSTAATSTAATSTSTAPTAVTSAAISANASTASASTSTEEQVEIQGQRIEEQAQTKVEASQRFPIRLTGMALFNTFLNSRQNGGSDYPTAASATPGTDRAGATVRQTQLGLEYFGPRTFLGGNVHGALYMDFYQGAAPLQEWIRLRTATLQVDWATRGIKAGVDKPIFNPREPDSLAQVGVSPLTGAGNLWLWMPQLRLEQDFSLGASSGLRAQMGAVETHEANPYGPTPPGVQIETVRPGVEGHFEAWHKLDDERRLELAVGFHSSTTHADGFSIPSNLVSLDWFFNPWRRVEFSGAFFSGQNVANLGTGAVNQGYYIYGSYAEAIDSRGGWGQLTIHTVRRLDLHLFTGQQDYRAGQLRQGSVGRNLLFGGNLFFRVAPNVLLGPEVTELRTFYLGLGNRIDNHYDLALAYRF